MSLSGDDGGGVAVCNNRGKLDERHVQQMDDYDAYHDLLLSVFGREEGEMKKKICEI